nr:MAG TPA: hypothetical protein [Caudoviricetes sp.]
MFFGGVHTLPTRNSRLSRRRYPPPARAFLRAKWLQNPARQPPVRTGTRHRENRRVLPHVQGCPEPARWRHHPPAPGS